MQHVAGVKSSLTHFESLKLTPSVSEVNPKDAAPAGRKLGLYGLYGFASIVDRSKWTETAEYAKVIESVRDVAQKTGMEPLKIHGRDLFHVKFEADF